MAVVKTINKDPKKQMSNRMTSNAHIFNALNYITRKDKTTPELTYCNLTNSNFTNWETTKFFQQTRKMYDKDNKILAHHLVQSFAVDDKLTPELANKIGRELIHKCFPDMQVVMTTHLDGKCLHNHFIINSVSPIDGHKFLDNMKTVRMIRRVSDELCYKYGLNVIENPQQTCRLDDATFRKAIEGKSWKFNLVNDIDKALEDCKTKEEFINFFESNDYEIKYGNAHIVFHKNVEAKSIRADTLAKQFGNKYCKANIDKALGLQTEKKKKKTYRKENTQKVLEEMEQEAKRQWERYEKRYADKVKVTNHKYFENLRFFKNPFVFTLKLIKHIFTNSKKSVHKNVIKQNLKYTVRQTTDYTKMKKRISNVPYKELTGTLGNTAQIKLYSFQLAKLFNDGILCYANVDMTTGIAMVMVKEHNLKRIANVLGLENADSIISQADTIRNKKTYARLKKSGKELEYLMVNKKQIEILNLKCVQFAKFQKSEDKFNIVFLENDKDRILNLLYPNKSTEPTAPTFVQVNSQINRRLKKQSEETGEKLCYKVISSKQYDLIKNSDIDYAVFKKENGSYNLVFLESNSNNINNILYPGKKVTLQ